MIKKPRRKYRKRSKEFKERASKLALAKVKVRKRDKLTCQRCGKKNLVGRSGNVSHVVAKETCKELESDQLNLKMLCFTCHKRFWHLNPLQAAIWFKAKFPKRYKYLMNKVNEHKNI